MRFGIPKEIKAKPKLLGLELKEWAIIGLIIVFSLTVFSDMVHKIFIIPFYIVVGLSVIFLFSPSSANPKKKNYHSILIWLKRDRKTYHVIDSNTFENERLLNRSNETYKKLREEKQKSIKLLKKEASVEYENMKEPVVTDSLDKEKFIEEKIQEQNTQVNDEKMLEQSIEKPLSYGKGERSVSGIASEQKNKKQSDPNPITFVKERQELSRKKYTNQSKEVEQKMSERNENHNERNFKRRQKSKKRSLSAWVWATVAIVVSVASLLLLVRLDLFTNGNNADAENIVEQEDEHVVKGLRSFSLKNYDEAMNHFDEVDYESLSDDDKDVMLLTYLFGGKPEKAMALESTFDETIASYYKATRDMQKIRDLTEKVDSKVLDFEVAVDDRNFERIVELKDFVKIKDNRDEIILEAMLELDDLEGAKEFVSKNETEKLTVMMTEYEKEKKNKSKKKGD